MALQVGIVGLQNAGKTTLFRALTGAATTGRDNVGMAAVPDPRLRQLAERTGIGTRGAQQFSVAPHPTSPVAIARR